jgi:hypothetical protein
LAWVDMKLFALIDASPFRIEQDECSWVHMTSYSQSFEALSVLAGYQNN